MTKTDSLARVHRRAALFFVAMLAAGCGSDATATSNVTVDTEVDRVVITPPNATVDVGGSVQLRAAAQAANGSEIQGKSIAWSSSASNIASVSTTGAVTGVSQGSATITATSDGRRGTASVTVTPRGTSLGTITVNGSRQFQTMTGWEALSELGHVECDPRAYQTYRNEVLDRAVNELGLNRIGTPLRAGYENSVDYFARLRAGQITFRDWQITWFQPVNDNNDPRVINPAGFNWGYLDYVIEQIVLPLRQRVQAKGENLWWAVGYGGSGNAIAQALHRNNPDEYAEFILASFQHIQQKYGLVPNSLELVNEPNIAGWTPQHVGNVLLAVKARLNQAGFFPQFVGPSASSAYVTGQFFDQMIQMPGVAQALNEISWHRFGDNQPSYLQGLAQRGAQYGMRTAMLEMGGVGHEELHADLTLANVSAWKQFGLAFCGTNDGGGLYFLVAGANMGENNPVVNTGKFTKYLRQYFRYVRHQAVRVEATSANATFAPVAFRNANGKYVVVVKAAAGGSFTVGGLPAGTYGIDYTTASQYMQPLADVTISSAQSISTAIPATGVLTIFAK